MDKELIENAAKLIVKDYNGYLPQNSVAPLSDFILSVVTSKRVKTESMSLKNLFSFIQQNYLFRRDTNMENLISVEPLNMGESCGIIDLYSKSFFNEKGGVSYYDQNKALEDRSDNIQADRDRRSDKNSVSG